MAECKFCGQVVLDADTEREATERCVCFGAERLRKRKKAATEAKGNVEEMFGEACKARGLVPLNDGIIKALCSVCDLFASGDASQLSLTVPGICVIKMSLVGDAIKVTRSEGRKYEAVAGEK